MQISFICQVKSFESLNVVRGEVRVVFPVKVCRVGGVLQAGHKKLTDQFALPLPPLVCLR